VTFLLHTIWPKEFRTVYYTSALCYLATTARATCLFGQVLFFFSATLSEEMFKLWNAWRV